MLIAVSPFAKKGFVDHTYADHASILKFIERNWGLSPLSARSRDNLPNPVVRVAEPYFPSNSPAIGDLMEIFEFPTHDFNNDGRSDIAWRDSSGNTAIWLMNGTAVINQTSSFVANVPTNWGIVGQRDFNSDGYADLLWQDTNGNVAIWEMNGTTVINQNSSFVANVPTNWSIVGTGDFNGDGKGRHLVAGHVGQRGDLGDERHHGHQSEQLVRRQRAGPTGAIVGTGDFNGDGKADILWQDTSGNVAIWEMDGTSVLNQNSSFVANVSSQWSIKGTGDFNGDGLSDILWQDISGNVAIWEMNGTSVLNPNSLVRRQRPKPMVDPTHRRLQW